MPVFCRWRAAVTCLVLLASCTAARAQQDFTEVRTLLIPGDIVFVTAGGRTLTGTVVNLERDRVAVETEGEGLHTWTVPEVDRITIPRRLTRKGAALGTMTGLLIGFAIARDYVDRDQLAEWTAAAALGGLAGAGLGHNIVRERTIYRAPTRSSSASARALVGVAPRLQLSIRF